MSIDSIMFKTASVPEFDFPKLMVSRKSGTVILADRITGDGTLRGTIVYVESGGWPSHTLGHYSDDWSIRSFTDFHGSVSLKNKEE